MKTNYRIRVEERIDGSGVNRTHCYVEEPLVMNPSDDNEDWGITHEGIIFDNLFNAEVYLDKIYNTQQDLKGHKNLNHYRTESVRGSYIHYYKEDI